MDKSPALKSVTQVRILYGLTKYVFFAKGFTTIVVKIRGEIAQPGRAEVRNPLVIGSNPVLSAN